MDNILTEPANLSQPLGAYWINSAVSDDLADVISQLQTSIEKRFPGKISRIPRNSLHISFSALTPFMDTRLQTSENKPDPKNIEAFSQTISHHEPIELIFDTIEAFPAAIIIKAHDDNSYQKLRENFTKSASLPEDTKPAPNIIHITICKFSEPFDFIEISNYVHTLNIEKRMIVSEFQIIREKILYMIDFDILQSFKLTYQ